jgi:UV DNA damage endonuclease
MVEEWGPKIHFSSPRADLRQVKSTMVNVAPVWTGHADSCNPFEFATFMGRLMLLSST